MKILILLLVVSLSEAAFAQSSARFTITRAVIAGGGATASSSSRFQLSGTVGQPLAAVPDSSRFSIQGGFSIRPSPIIFAPKKLGNNFVVSFQTEPGETYQVQYLDSLLALNWQDLPGVAGDGAVHTITNSAPGVTQQYFRLLEQP